MRDVHSTPRLPLFGMQIAGAALGGVLGAALGLRVMLSSAGWGLSVVTLLLALSPIRRIRDLATTRESSVRP